MQAIVYRRYGSADVLRLEEIPRPIPAAREVLVKIHSASVNAADRVLLRGEPFIVPSQGKNVPGGMEWMRLLFSQEGGRVFAESTRSLTTVAGSGEGLDLGTAFASTQEVIAAAGENTYVTQYQDWYTEFGDEVKAQLAALLQMQISIEEFQTNVQDAADFLKDDTSITKYTR